MNNNDNNEENKDKSSKNNEVFRFIAYFSQIGITIASSIFLGVLLGKYLDDWLGTSPWLLLIFSFLGVGAAIKVLFNIPKGRK